MPIPLARLNEETSVENSSEFPDLLGRVRVNSTPTLIQELEILTAPLSLFRGIDFADDRGLRRKAIVDYLRFQARTYNIEVPGYVCHCISPSIKALDLCDRLSHNPKEWYMLKTSEIQDLSYTMDYRISMTRRATWFKDYLRISFPDCQVFDTHGWVKQLKRRGGTPLFSRFLMVENLILLRSKELFEHTTQFQGCRFQKLDIYMTLLFHLTGWSLDVIEAEIERLVQVIEEPIFRNALLHSSAGSGNSPANLASSSDSLGRRRRESQSEANTDCTSNCHEDISFSHRNLHDLILKLY